MLRLKVGIGAFRRIVRAGSILAPLLLGGCYTMDLVNEDHIDAIFVADNSDVRGLGECIYLELRDRPAEGYFFESEGRYEVRVFTQSLFSRSVDLVLNVRANPSGGSRLDFHTVSMWNNVGPGHRRAIEGCGFRETMSAD